MLTFGLGGEKGQTVSGTLDAVLKGILLECNARLSGELRDLQRARPAPGHLLFFVGPGALVEEGVSVAEAEIGLPAAAADAIETERLRQQRRIQKKDPKAATVVWLANAPLALASIASDKWLNDGNMASYGRSPPFGILGRFESNLNGVTLIAPLWIWHEGW